jgi:Cytochrome bd terminal oxidase subunit I
MNSQTFIDLSRWQFATTAAFHMTFPALTVGLAIFLVIWRALLENLRPALPRTTIIAAIHDRTFDHLPVPADATVRLAAGRVLRVT